MKKTSELIALARKPVSQLTPAEFQTLSEARDKLFEGLPSETTFGEACAIKAAQGDLLAQFIMAQNKDYLQ